MDKNELREEPPKETAATLEAIGKKFSYKNITITLSEEEWFILSQVSILTGFNKEALLRTAINQLLRDIYLKKQKTTRETQVATAAQEGKQKFNWKGPTRMSSSRVPEWLWNAMAQYATRERIRNYEAYSRAIDEFCAERKKPNSTVSYRMFPPDVIKRSLGVLESSLERLKEIKNRDVVPEYLLIYNALAWFAEKYDLRDESPTTGSTGSTDVHND